MVPGGRGAQERVWRADDRGAAGVLERGEAGVLLIPGLARTCGSPGAARTGGPLDPRNERAPLWPPGDQTILTEHPGRIMQLSMRASAKINVASRSGCRRDAMIVTVS